MMIPGADLQTWAASLVVDFPKDNIPLLYNVDEWQKWGNSVVQELSFSANGAPGTYNYGTWNEWAKAVFLTMANF